MYFLITVILGRDFFKPKAFERDLLFFPEILNGKKVDYFLT